MKRNILIFSFFFLIGQSCFSLASDVEISGYVKYLYTQTKWPFFNSTFNDHLIHSRLNVHFYPTNNLKLVTEFRWRTYYGNSVSRIPNFKQWVTHDYPFANLAWTVKESGKLLSYLETDRLYLDYMTQSWQITLGRQRIAWGTCLVWNIIDLFNPMSYLDFDYEERPGSDALRFQYFTGSLSRVEVAVKPDKSKDKQVFAFLWATHITEYDIYLLLARWHNNTTLGMALSGYIKDAGFRAEFRWNAPQNKTRPLPLLATDDWKLVLSVDYTFSNSFYIHSEVFHNYNGLTDKIGIYHNEVLQTGLPTLARWSLFQEFAYDLHPLVRANVFMMYNPDDGSKLFGPSLSWSVGSNLDLYVISFLTKGSNTSEFGSLGRANYLRLKYSF